LGGGDDILFPFCRPQKAGEKLVSQGGAKTPKAIPPLAFHTFSRRGPLRGRGLGFSGGL